MMLNNNKKKKIKLFKLLKYKINILQIISQWEYYYPILVELQKDKLEPEY